MVGSKKPTLSEEEEQNEKWKPITGLIDKLFTARNPAPHGSVSAMRPDYSSPFDTSTPLQKLDRKAGEVLEAVIDGTKESIDEWKKGRSQEVAGNMGSPRTPAGKPAGRTPDGRT
jgi:hypothetical protein